MNRSKYLQHKRKEFRLSVCEVRGSLAETCNAEHQECNLQHYPALTGASYGMLNFLRLAVEYLGERLVEGDLIFVGAWQDGSIVVASVVACNV